MAKKSGVIGNMLWKFAERISAQLVTTVVSVILARLLLPSDYGTIALVTSFITIANVFVSDGFGSALVQKKNADALDFFSVLYFNIGFSTVLYGILFFLAPYLALFFGEGYEILCPVLRVLGLRIILSAVNSVQQAYVSKKMIFRKFFYATLSATILSAIVGISMAYLGFGIWSLVAQYLVNTFVGTIFLSISIGRRPQLIFSFKRLRGLVGFGSRVLGTNVLISFYTEMRAFLIGKFYTTSDLAYYKKGNHFPSLLISNVSASVSAVLFPKFSEIQTDVQLVKAMAKKSIKTSFYIIAPMLFGLAAVADNFVVLLLTETWAPCIPFLQLFCLNNLFYIMHSTNMQLVKAMGRSDMILRYEMIKKIIELMILMVTVFLGPIWIVAGMVTTSTLFTYVNCIPTKKLIGYSFFEQMKDILPTLLISIGMIVSVLLVGLLPMNRFFLLVLQVLTGVLVYILLSVLTKNNEFFIVKDLLLGFLGKKGKK